MLEIGQVRGNPITSIALRIRIPTARNKDFPRVAQEQSKVEIQLPQRYPFQGPLVSFKTPIWNPNVYSSGQLCYGNWKVMEYLDLFVRRLMQVIALDPAIINPKSPANTEASHWYDRARRANPRLFPTVVLDHLIEQETARQISWRDIK